MKILLVYEWCQVGGVEAFMVALSGVLRAEGHICELFFFERGPMQQHIPAECPVHFGDLAECVKLVQTRGFDIVHANSSDVRIGIAAVREAGAKLIVTAHGMVVPAWNSSNCDALVSCSEWQAKEQQPLTDIKVEVVMNGIDTHRFAPDAKISETAPPIVAWVGRGTDMVHKRIDRLANIAPQLREAGVRLWLAEPYGAEQVAEVAPEAARVLEECAEFWSNVPKKELPIFFQRVAASGGVVLSTSIREGFGLAIAEAQGCGCPVVGANVRGVNEVVRPEHGGELYDFDITDEALAEVVLKVIADKEGLKRRGKACAEYVKERFNLQRMAEEYFSVYRKTLDESRLQNTKSTAKRFTRTLDPVLNWRGNIERGWSAAISQYEASRKLAANGEWRLAAAVARLSAQTCPTLYLRPQRFLHLVKTLLRPKAFSGKHQTASAGEKNRRVG